MQEELCNELTEEEKPVLHYLKIISTVSVPSDDEKEKPISLAEIALKRHLLNSTAAPSEYMDLRFLLPTSNIFERLFSKSGFVLNDLRKGILPCQIESQMFLHVK